MKKELLPILSSNHENCTTKSKFTDKFEENSNMRYEEFLAHEIRNTLNDISGMTSFLAKTKLTAYQRSLLDRITVSASMASELLSVFLAYSRTGNFEVRNVEFSISSIFDTLNDSYRLPAEKKNLKYLQSLSVPDNLYVRSGRFQLFHILSNLLGNALKYTEEGYIEPGADIVSETSDTVTVRFFVKDSGMGIPEEVMKNVFGSDRPIPAKSGTGGHGFGLYICRALVEELGGTLKAESDESGSCFCFALTFEKASPPVLPAALEKCRVLVIDDDCLNCEIISDCLAPCGAVCDNARTGEEAIEMCRHLPCDYYSVIFTDVCMPGISGLETAEVLKSDVYVSAPVVAVSGSECSSPYIDACVLKPVDRAEILDIAGKAATGSLGVSKANAVARLGDRQELYDKYYNRFIKNYTDSGQELRRLLSENNYDAAYRVAHSIKGLSGTLGLADVYGSAARLADSLHDKEFASETDIKGLEESLNKLLP